MRIITVSGAHSGIGKTRVAETLLKNLKGWSALKISVVHKGLCPTGRNCGACKGLSSDYSISADMGQGKDTQRLKSAGAKKVLWLRARPEGLKMGLKASMSRFAKAKGLIIESTSALRYLKPDLAILIKGKSSALKPSARKILKKIDLILTL